MLKYSLGPREITELLEKGEVGHLATIGVDGPYVIPVNYVFMEGKIYLHGRKAGGEKLDNIRSDDRVCFEVFKCDGYLVSDTACKTETIFISAIGRGKARILDGETAKKQAALLKFASKYAPHLTDPVIPDDKATLTAVIELTIDSWTGKRSKAGPN
jgi:nitroimidazol reductase NimA-like FMN-containing flavoprotein (pyridoxamine 5'-phosphate oxidase superfamily)